ncbi:TonB-dependent receptor domain-containing protein [Granulicella tundricola]|uniref:TonB-dependent receptor plug n=1 Tax=Granulicella tundricola (strain ATCC BAA-1859 / DSM 23138 / MP5ACTX9) TaxID=1198114 RepID=E8X693_GRATM|nr:TonB-dependent receptor [Granulicella tundricola]ADW70977.1 TonB-dependent receptor plug [Granulicella tundricola MP5ACTX9]
MKFCQGLFRPRFVAAYLVLLAGSFVGAAAQDITGTISGTVTDASGAAIKGATVTLTNTDRGQDVRTLTTNGAGFYTGTSLPLGVYTVKVVDGGFKTESVTGLVLHVDDSLTVNRQLQVGSTDQSVTVQADALAVNLENSAVSGLINGTQVRELTLSTRNYEQLLSLQPGVAYTGATDQIYLGPTNPLGGANTVAFSVGGQRTSANNWTIDGADNVDRGSNLTLLAFPSVDAIAEFQTLRGVYSAQYGRSAAGQVNVVTRSGTNQFHGSAYEFFRNDVLQANNYFSNLSALKRPPLRYNDFGYTIGGPVFIPKIYDGHDKTFVFFSQEFRRVITYSPVTMYLPTANERTGLFPVAVCANVNSSGSCNNAGTTQLTTISPLAQAYLKDIYSTLPLPNPAAGQDMHQFTYNGRNVYNDTQEFFRIDQAFGQKFNVFYRFLHDSIPTQEPFGYGSGSVGFPGVQNSQTTSPATQHLGHVTYVATPTLLVDGGYAYSFGAIISRPVGTGTLAGSPDIKATLPYPVTLGVVPNLSFTSLTGINDAGNYNDYNRNHNIFANVTKVIGNHTIIVGGTFDRYQKTENATGGNNGTFSFTATTAQLPTATKALNNADQLYYQSFANFLSGTATGGFTQTALARTPNLHANTYEGYVQDNWKVTPRLTLNLGVRYSYFSQPTDSSGLLSNFLPSTYVAANAPTIDSTGSICTVAPCANAYGINGTVPNASYDPLNGLAFVNPAIGHASPYGNKVGQADTKNFGPRLGLAWDVFGTGKTSFRMGYGLAYDATLFGDYEINAFNNPPATAVANYTFTSFDNPAGAGATTAAAVTALPTIYSESEHYHTPYSQQYSLDIQQQMTPSLMLDVGYVGSHDTHLIGYIDINSLPVGAAKAAGLIPTGGIINSTQTKVLNQIRQYKGYGGMYGDDTIFTSNYNSLQVAVKKRFRGKSQINGAYTWQRLLTNSPADRSGAPQDRFNIRNEYGRSVLDRTDYASIDFIYELPFYKDQKGLVGRVVGGWEVSGIVALDSGLPITVAASAGNPINGVTFTDAGGLGIIGSSPAGFRPDQLFDPRNGTGLKTRQKWFNTAAFAAPSAALGQPGNARRGTIIGPGFNREDLGIFRNFRIFRESEFQLRGEAFNVLNHTNLGAPAVTATTATTFGTITSAREARILQIGGKLSF